MLPRVPPLTLCSSLISMRFIIASLHDMCRMEISFSLLFFSGICSTTQPNGPTHCRFGCSLFTRELNGYCVRCFRFDSSNSSSSVGFFVAAAIWAVCVILLKRKSNIIAIVFKWYGTKNCSKFHVWKKYIKLLKMYPFFRLYLANHLISNGMPQKIANMDAVDMNLILSWSHFIW